MSKKKKQKNAQAHQPFNAKKYIREAARKLPIHECYIDNTMYTYGMGYVIVSRKRQNGQIVYANFLVDLYCLGVKDAHCDVILEEDYQEIIDALKEDANCELVIGDTNYVFNLVYGAVEYAEDLGISPHKDFELAQYLLDDIESVEYIDIEFGKEGRPCYIPMEGEKSGRILAMLDQKIGHGNYDYISTIQQMGLEDDYYHIDGEDGDDKDYHDYEEE